MSLFVAKHYQLVAGTGEAPTILNAFDRALMAAGVSHFNLVKVSSILPPAAVASSADDQPAGGVMFAAIGSIGSELAGERIAAAVSVGIPKDPRLNGVIMETHSIGTAKDLNEMVREMARLALEDRGFELLRIESTAVDTVVKAHGAAMAAVLLW